MSSKDQQIENGDDDDDDVMITEVTSAPIQHPSSSAHEVQKPSNAVDVITKMGLMTSSNTQVMEALKAMQATACKRGPKEKDTFQRFIYCLPDQNDKLPRFSSSDERHLVKQHQSQGYGYPPDEFNSIIPKRTHIPVKLTEKGFDKFLKKIYPKLANRSYELYRIDKQRRLICLENRTPRAIKDMKYQGTIVIIPYDKLNEKPPTTLHRYQDYCRSARVSVSQKDIPGTQVVGVTDTTQSTIPLQQSNAGALTPSINGPNSSMQSEEDEQMPIIVKVESNGQVFKGAHLNKRMKRAEESTVITKEPRHTTLKDVGDIFERTEYLRCHLKSEGFYIHIDENNLVHSFLQVYRQSTHILDHKIVVCCVNHELEQNERHQQMAFQPYLTKFWDEIFDLCFEGDKEKVPVCVSDVPDDLFIVLGRIIFHGLVLHNYWPMRLSQACAMVIMTDTVSEKQLAESFKNFLSEEQKRVISFAKEEIQSGASEFLKETQISICKALRTCGNNIKPVPSSFESNLLRLARFCFIQRPYWCLCQIRLGMQTIHKDLFTNLEGKDVFSFYNVLMPSALSLFDKIVYIFSTCDEDPDTELEEKRVKHYLENFVLSLNSLKLSKLLLLWCQADCLNSHHFYVRYSTSSISQRPVFDSEVATLTLSSVYTSQDEFNLIMSQEL